MTKKIILVTGGSGLVGNGIRIASERDPRDDETFIFLSSKDADLTNKDSTRKVWLICSTSSKYTVELKCHLYFMKITFSFSASKFSLLKHFDDLINHVNEKKDS
jgi:hypothetical protein